MRLTVDQHAEVPHTVVLTLVILLALKKNPPMTQLFLLTTMALPPLLAAKLMENESEH